MSGALAEMVDKRHLDVWIIQTNVVYRAVPYTVVTDWLQQGRLLGEDQLRYSGTEKWVKISTVPSLAAFLPREEPGRVNDQAEALEPVAVDFQWSPTKGEADEDVDMIPLIDVSLVLLIFFMMTTVTAIASSIDVPRAFYKAISVEPEMLWVGIDSDEHYSLGQGDAGKGEPYATRPELVNAIETKLKSTPPVKIRIRAHKDLPYDTVREVIAELGRFRINDQAKAQADHGIVSVFAEVSEKQDQ
jgi:biopolymer transport protein ExbD